MLKSLLPSTLAFVLCACQPSLEHQPKIGILEEPRGFVPGTELYAPVAAAEKIISRKLILRGKDRYEIYCSVCHGITGDGDGMATERGFGAPQKFAGLKPEAFTFDRLQKVISNGQGRMMGFANRLDSADRFAVAAYIQVLQLRGRFPVKNLTAADRSHLKEEAP